MTGREEIQSVAVTAILMTVPISALGAYGLGLVVDSLFQLPWAVKVFLQVASTIFLSSFCG